MPFRFSAAIAFALCSSQACSAQSPVPQAIAPGHVEVFLTTANGARRFSERPQLRFVNGSHGKGATVAVDDRMRFQTIEGFGAAMTGSSAHLIAQLPDRGRALLADLYGSESTVGLSIARITIGSSDFSNGDYTYDDRGFSIEADGELFGVLDRLQQSAGGVELLASPWTAPPKMKTTRAYAGGTLRRGYAGIYANYLLSYVRALAARHIALFGITPQNEPYFSGSDPSMTLTPSLEGAIVRALGPKLRREFPATKLVIYDGNWDKATFPLEILADRRARPYVAAIGFHCYAGGVEQMSDAHAAYTGVPIYLTECGGGSWAPSFGDDLEWDMRNLFIGGTRNWASSVLLWNVALDDRAGPTNGGCTNCRGVVTIHPDGTYTRNVEYYALEHFAKYVRPGAVRIGSTSSLGILLPNAAFENRDGSKVLVVLNDATHAQQFTTAFRGRKFGYALASGAVATFRWK